METLSHSALAAIDDACDKEFLSAAQLKEILKIAQSAVHQTKRAFALKEVSEIWQPFKWEEASKKLEISDTLKSAVGLQTICKQIAQIAGQEPKKNSGAGKRKAGEAVEKGGVEKEGKKPKRKKVKKSQRYEG